MEPANGDFNESTNEVKTYIMRIKWDPRREPHCSSIFNEKDLEILIIATIATIKVKNKKCGPEDVFSLVKDSLETGPTRENLNECLGYLISNKSVKGNTINSRECL